MSVDLKIITYNVHLFGGLSSVVLGVINRLVKLVHDEEQRLGALTQVLQDAGADIVCLQEIWSDTFKERLISGLRHIYPHSFYPAFANGPHFGKVQLGSGLLLLSRHPIIAANFTPFGKLSGEDAFAQKGVICATLHVDGPDGVYPVSVMNTHTQAGGGDINIQYRSDNINDIVAAATRHRLGHRQTLPEFMPRILVGDMNIVAETPSGSRTGEHLMLCRELRAFTDLAAALYPDRRAFPLYTSDPAGNGLIPLFDPHDHTPGRLDYVFVENINIGACSLAVPIHWRYGTGTGDMDISDHYPVLAKVPLSVRMP